MNTLRKTIVGIIGTVAMVSSVGAAQAAVYAHEIPALENEDETDSVEIQHPHAPNFMSHFKKDGDGEGQLSLDEAKQKLAEKLDKLRAHLDEVLAKIQANANLTDDQKAKAANGITKVKDIITALEAKIADAQSLQDLKGLRKDLRKDARHFMVKAKKDLREWRHNHKSDR
jgi:chromosome segregation ATPase